MVLRILNLNKAGFTLLELLVSMVIILVSMLGLLASINLAISSNVGNELRFQAVGLSEEILGNYKKMPFSQITSNRTDVLQVSLRGTPRDFTVTRNVTTFTDTKQITVGVAWNYNNKVVEHTVSSLVGKSYGDTN